MREPLRYFTDEEDQPPFLKPQPEPGVHEGWHTSRPS
jgi:hypothetical protein